MPVAGRPGQEGAVVLISCLFPGGFPIDSCLALCEQSAGLDGNLGLIQQGSSDVLMCYGSLLKRTSGLKYIGHFVWIA